MRCDSKLMPDVLMITVNYKGADATERFLASATGLEGQANSRILVVENGSEDGSAERLRSLVPRFSNVELLESPTNRGYFGAANWALQQFLARGRQPDWTIICNNDLIFDDHQFLQKLFQHDPKRGQVIAPSIVARQTGVDCNPFMRERPTRSRLMRYRFWQSHYYLMWTKQLLSPYVRALRYHLSLGREVPSSEKVQVYAPHGAFLIFSRGYFEAGGYIDDGFFLYAEELSVAEICLRLKLPVIHDRELKVLHDGRHVTGRLCNRVSFRQGREGLEYALRTYFFAPEAGKSRPLQS
jgi:GT2 family glycosyltransferase